MPVRQSWVRDWYLSLGATAHVQFYGIYFNVLRSQQRGAAAAAAAATDRQEHVPAVVAAGMLSCKLCSHAVLVVSSMRTGIARGRDGGVF